MARRVKGENRGARTNGRSTSVANAGETLGPRRVGQRESSSVGPTNGMSGAQAEGQDHLHQQIAELAYVLYERSGFQEGKDLAHWLEAEQQVKGVRGEAA